MVAKHIWLIGAAALALAGCGGDDGASSPSATSREATKVSAGSPLEQPFRLADAEEADIDALLALLPSDARPSYDSAAFDEGLGATVVTNLRFADADDGEAVIVERTEFYGVDEEAIALANEPHEEWPNSPMEKVFAKVRFLNIRSTGLEDEGAEGSLSLDGIEFDALSVRRGAGAALEPGDDAELYNAFALGGLYFQNFEFALDADEGQKIQMSAPDFRIVGVGEGRVDAVIAKELSYAINQGPAARAAIGEAMGPQAAILLDGPLGVMIAPENQQATIETFEWRDIDLSGALDYALRGEEAPLDARDLINLGAMNLVNMETFVNGRLASSLGEANVSRMNFIGFIPSDFRIDVEDGIVDYTAYVQDPESEAFAVMKERGLDAIPSDGFAEWTWDPNTGAGDFSYAANSDGFANFSMGLDLAGLTMEALKASRAEDTGDALAREAELKSFSMKIEDESALDALFALSALQMGGTGEDLRQSAPALIRLSGAQFSQLHPRMKDYIEAAASFVAEGGTIEINASPEEPFSAARLQSGEISPQSLPDTLNLRVTHEPAD